MSKIDTKEIRDNFLSTSCYLRKQTSTHGWLKIDYKYIIIDLCDAYDAQQEEIKNLKLCLDMANQRALLTRDIAQGASENVNVIRTQAKEIERLNGIISTLLNPHMKHGVIKGIDLQESK